MCWSLFNSEGLLGGYVSLLANSDGLAGVLVS